MSRKSITFLLLLIATQLIAEPIAAAKNTERYSISTQSSTENQPAAAESICPAQLPQAIDAIANRPQFSRARWGMSIQTLSDAQTLYSRDSQRYFLAASNVKLFTTAAALRQLGAAYRIRTSVYGNEDVLRVVGRGDPSLTDAQLQDLAQQLKRRGIRQVKQLIVEDGYLSGEVLNPEWEWGDVYSYYGTSVNSLILNQNAVTLTFSPQNLGQPLKAVWADPLAALQWQLENESVTAASGEEGAVEISGVLGKPILRIRGQLAADAKPEAIAVAIRDPAQYFLQHFRLALAAAGITVAQAVVAAKNTTASEPELAAVESPPLSQLIADTNIPSNNLYAEVLLRTLSLNGTPNNGTPDNSAQQGLNIVKANLTQLGVDPANYVLADGSGLSRHNLVSPQALVQMLQAMARSPQANIFRASLPVAGVSGTLRNRFKDTPAQGIVQAKTGTLSGVVALSGYIDVPNYQTVVFSIIVNQSELSATPLRQAVDEMVVLLTRLRRC
jgi:serine-type D-Ala-D-Ala carboxypeptidase/endopeptidase (penicillin-binding protein 4)